PAHVPAGGESLAAVGTRVRAACRELAGAAADGDVVVVSHVSPIKAAIAWALGVGDEVAWRMWVADAAVCRIDTAGPAPRLLAREPGTAHDEQAAALLPAQRRDGVEGPVRGEDGRVRPGGGVGERAAGDVLGDGVHAVGERVPSLRRPGGAGHVPGAAPEEHR